jgi:hypothetical protein
MSDDSQLVVPPSFVALFVPAGRIRPTAPRDEIAARYEVCEDLAQALVETAQTRQFQLGIDAADVLERITRGLAAQPELVSPDEATWVRRRLAELLGWDDGEAGMAGMAGDRA